MLRQLPSSSNPAVSNLFFHLHLEDNHILNQKQLPVWFMDGYAKGLTGADAVRVSQKYKGHRVLLPNTLDEVKKINLMT